MEKKMKALKLFVLPLLATSLVMTGCASRKPAATIDSTQGLSGTNSGVTVSTQGLSDDAALNAQNLAGASAKGVTEANKPYLAC